MSEATRPPLITSLLSPDAYPHSVETIQLRETHISWVLLTGAFAYKIKKPVDLGFVDFTTLERRRHFCELELRLNRRLAPDLYLDVAPIGGPTGARRLWSFETPVEFAVQMRQFDERELASELLADGRLTESDVDGLAARLARFHETLPCADNERWGTAAQIAEPTAGNFAELGPLIDDPSRLAQLETLEDWSRRTCDRLRATFRQRRSDGFVRECHGDMHLGNIVRWQGAMTPFDCIEFNPEFRWIDVMNEVAFLVMDLEDHNRPDFAWRFLNAYLEQTGDYAGLSVLPFYLVYRAIVRAKVDALRIRQAGLSFGERRQLTTEWHEYLDLAERYTQQRSASLAITCGVSGSGKTTGTQKLVERCGAIRIRSDVERKRRFGLKSTEDAAVAVDAGIYSPAETEATYDRLARRAQAVIAAGVPVVVDATFLKRTQRRRFQDLAAGMGVPFRIIPFGADEELLRERIRCRHAAGSDASDATADVLQHQLRTFDALTEAESAFVIDAEEFAATCEMRSRRHRRPPVGGN